MCVLVECCGWEEDAILGGNNTISNPDTELGIACKVAENKIEPRRRTPGAEMNGSDKDLEVTLNLNGNWLSFRDPHFAGAVQ